MYYKVGSVISLFDNAGTTLSIIAVGGCDLPRSWLVEPPADPILILMPLLCPVCFA